MPENQLEDWQLALLVESRRLNNPTVVEANQAEEYRDYKPLIKRARDLDEPVVVEREVKDLHERTEALRKSAEGIDDPKIVESEEWEALQEATNAASDAFSEALKDHHDLRDEVVESMGLPAMVSQFTDDDEQVSLESLAQHPTTGGEDEDPVAEPDDPDDDPETLADALDALDASTRNEAREELKKAERMDGYTPKFAENKRIEVLNDILGLDESEFDPEDLSVEAL